MFDSFHYHHIIIHKTVFLVQLGCFLLFPSFLIAEGLSVEQQATPYVERRSYGTQRELEPPRYTKNISQTPLAGLSDVDWLDLGLEYRLRYEYRRNDFRRTVETLDQPFLLRTRLYFGLKEILDPFRFAVEYQDSRRANSQFESDARDINKHEPIQAYGELYFDELIPHGQAISLRYGRMTLEQIDRRLIARNEWRNTTNTFQGFRTILGTRKNIWELDMFALQPLTRIQEKIDDRDHAQWFHGLIFDWRAWSQYITLTPYYLLLRQHLDGNPNFQTTTAPLDRLVHTYGLRGYAVFDESGFDYDGSIIGQTGHDGPESHRAYAYNVEAGYTAPHHWKPRFSGFLGVASGDRDPQDGHNNRFERLFGFARPWSNNDYFQMENIVAPKLRIEFTPVGDLRIDSGFSWYYLQSASDRWLGGNLRDPKGESGKNIGQEADIRIRFPIARPISANVGYAYFMSGSFTKQQLPLRTDISHFFYTELSLIPF